MPKAMPPRMASNVRVLGPMSSLRSTKAEMPAQKPNTTAMKATMAAVRLRISYGLRTSAAYLGPTTLCRPVKPWFWRAAGGVVDGGGGAGFIVG